MTFRKVFETNATREFDGDFIIQNELRLNHDLTIWLFVGVRELSGIVFCLRDFKKSAILVKKHSFFF